MKRTLALLCMLCCCLCAPQVAAASGSWILFTENAVPESLGFMVSEEEYSGTVTVTLLGDCTLGSEESKKGYANGYIRRIEKNGLDYPLQNLTSMTLSDDLTVANLECVLTDRELKKVDKTFNFSGPTAFTGILTAGGIDCVTLANNHTHDYGDEGYQDTKDALDAAGVSYFGTDCLAIWQHEDGLRIGFTGVSNSLSGDRSKRFARQVALLRSLGCAAVITVMHTGTEYAQSPDNYQHQITDRAKKNGIDLVVGHHPHIVQGYEILDGMPVVYSLGNCTYGGRISLQDSDALVLQAELHFEEGVFQGSVLHFYPISITSNPRYNDYCPVFLTGKDAQRVLTKMEKSTGNTLGEFSESAGAVLRCDK